MPGTKIINVLRDDKFEDILRLFQDSSAQEVIFVIPQKSKFLNEEGHFTVLAAAAEEHDKNILILSSSPYITELAPKYKFSVLSSNKNDKKTPKAKVAVQSALADEEDEADIAEEQQAEDAINTENAGDFDITPENDEPVAEPIYGRGREAEADVGNFVTQEMKDTSEAAEDIDSDIPPEEDYQIVTAARINRTLDDIVKPPEEDQVNVRISRRTEKPLRVEVKKSIESLPATESDAINQIQSVWQGKKESWSQPAEKKSFKIPSGVTGIKMPQMPRLNLPKKSVTLLGFAVVILLGIVIYVSTGSAHIIIKPRVSPLDLSIQVAASDAFQDVDLELRRIPGQLFPIDKNIEESFPATGERDVVQKARGKITIYNEYGTTPQVLIATTRFQSETGLIFRTLTTVTVPGTTVQNGKITPGAIQVEVIADKAGDAYNITAGKFTIPAFKEKGDNDRYQKFYGMSKELMKGGIIGKAKVVTEQDYISAKQKMEERIKTETEADLKQQTAGLKILTSFRPDMEEITPSAQIDEAVDNFTMTAKAKIQTVGFKESDLFLLISRYIEKANNLIILSEKLKLEFESIQFDKDNNKLEFVMIVKGPAYGKVDQDKIISDLAGKNEGEITSYIKGIDTIVSTRVLLSPFWVRKVPGNKDRVKLTIDYD